MRKKLTFFTFLALTCICAATRAVPSVYNGRIVVESKTVAPGSSFMVKVWLVGNDINVTSLRIPLRFDSQYLTCTYIDFSGSLKDVEMGDYYRIDDGELEFSYIPSLVYPLPVITADSGLIAILYFTTAGDAPNMTVTIDSIYQDDQFEQMGGVFHRWRRPEVADESGSAALEPAFVAGNIEIHTSTGINDGVNELLPTAFGLSQNYPNPFNPITTVPFALPEKAHIKLEVFNLLGQGIATLADGEFPPGTHEIIWDACGVPSGLYFYRITAGSKSITKKMLLLK